MEIRVREMEQRLKLARDLLPLSGSLCLAVRGVKVVIAFSAL